MTPREFFEKNPEATHCYEAMGLIRGKREEAEALIAGTKAEIREHERQTPVEISKKGGDKK